MVCCVTGHRPAGFPFPYDREGMEFPCYHHELSLEIEKIVLMGCTEFISGMADGVDLDFADIVLYLRDYKEYDITLEAAMPYPVIPTKKPTEYSERRDDVLFDCDTIFEVSPFFHKGCMQKRNRYMVDKADIVLAVWNGEEKGGTWDTIKYARSKNKTIRYLMLKDIDLLI